MRNITLEISAFFLTVEILKVGPPRAHFKLSYLGSFVGDKVISTCLLLGLGFKPPTVYKLWVKTFCKKLTIYVPTCNQKVQEQGRD